MSRVLGEVNVRIAQVSPLHERVPPRLYGGTERIVHYLTEELVAMGHEVTLFASGDSVTTGRLIAPVPEALRLCGCRDPIPPHILELEQVLARLHQFDIVHFHTDSWHLPFARRLGVPNVTTAHGRLDLPEVGALLWEFREQAMLSISDSQRSPVAWANWEATVYHGLPPRLYPFNPEPYGHRGGYLAFTGRIAPEKRPDLAIEIARRAGIHLKIAAKVDAADRAYFEHVVRPMLSAPGVEFIGEIGDSQKSEFLGNAMALLFPIDWPEPFGLVMIEAMSCGTPVIATRRGSVPEVIDHGRSGFIVDSVDEAVEAVWAIARQSNGGAGMRAGESRWHEDKFHLPGGRHGVRETFEARFTARRMAEDYLNVYRRLCGSLPEAHLSDEQGPEVPGAVAVGVEHGRNR